jgi:hypothetical protein
LDTTAKCFKRRILPRLVFLLLLLLLHPPQRIDRWGHSR